MINGKPMIQWVYEGVSRVRSISEVYVATDDERIAECVREFHGKAIMTSPAHTSGSDRLAEAAVLLQLQDDDIILNIRGDEPLIQEEMIYDLISTITDKDTHMGTFKRTDKGGSGYSEPQYRKSDYGYLRSCALFFPVPDSL